MNDYTEVLTTLMRFPGGQDPLEFFLAAVNLAENGGRIRTVTPPPEPVPPPRAIPPPPAPPARSAPPAPVGPIDLSTFRSKLVVFYQRYGHVFTVFYFCGFLASCVWVLADCTSW